MIEPKGTAMQHNADVDANLEESFAKETMLELVELDDGSLVLRDANGKEEPMVTINFSDKVKDMLDQDLRMVGQHMIHAAIQSIMYKQLNQWHANVYDEEPLHYS